MTQFETPDAAQQLVDAQTEEYGRYVAISPIDIGGARAFNPGHAVPVSHVKKYGYLQDGLVKEVPRDDEPRPALSGEPGDDDDEPRPALSGEPGDFTADTGSPDHLEIDLNQ